VARNGIEPPTRGRSAARGQSTGLPAHPAGRQHGVGVGGLARCGRSSWSTKAGQTMSCRSTIPSQQKEHYDGPVQQEDAISTKPDSTHNRALTRAGKLTRNQKRASFVEVTRKQVQPVSLHTRRSTLSASAWMKSPGYSVLSSTFNMPWRRCSSSMPACLCPG
jgi:hypothetical protein